MTGVQTCALPISASELGCWLLGCWLLISELGWLLISELGWLLISELCWLLISELGWLLISELGCWLLLALLASELGHGHTVRAGDGAVSG